MHEEIKRAFTSAAANRLDMVHEEHASILHFIEERNSDKAFEWLNKHLQNIDERVRHSFLSSMP
jgi:DNA-binding FadR family transcriptional regulator